jgi:trigger factor
MMRRTPIMNIVVEKQPKCVATLRVEIPAEKVLGHRKDIIHRFASRAKIPGFRPGKAPQAVVEKRYQKDISEELESQLVNEAFELAVTQEDLKVLDFGDPQAFRTAPDGGVSFVSTLTLEPEFTLPDYKDITVTVPPAEVPEEDLKAQLESLRERFADFNTADGRAAAMGDFAVIDYSSTTHPAGRLPGRGAAWPRDCLCRHAQGNQGAGAARAQRRAGRQVAARANDGGNHRADPHEHAE